MFWWISTFSRSFPISFYASISPNKIFVLLVQFGICFSEVQTNRYFLHLFIHSFIYSRNIYWVSTMPWHFVLGTRESGTEWEDPPVITLLFRAISCGTFFGSHCAGHWAKHTSCGRAHLFFPTTLGEILFLFHGSEGIKLLEASLIVSLFTPKLWFTTIRLWCISPIGW